VKLNGKKLDDFLRAPRPSKNFVLVYGPDKGLVHERAKDLAGKWVSSLKDPFSVSEFTADQLKADPARLSDAATSMSLTGEDQVIWIRDCGDKITDIIKAVIDDPVKAWPIIIEGGELAPRSSLRKLFETHDECAALACYADEGRGLERVITETLRSQGVTADREAIACLMEMLGGDRLVIRGELEKLALYVKGKEGDSSLITGEDVLSCIGNSSMTSLDELVYAVGNGNQPAIDAALIKAFSDGLNAVAIIRAVQRHFHRLHIVKGHMEMGHSLDSAVSGLRPPIFFKWKSAFQRQAQTWSLSHINRALSLATECEAHCKTTGMPAEVLCNRALMRIAQGARGR